MYKGKTILGVVVARGGSKGIPRKNIKDLAGLPLIAHTINAAKNSQYLDYFLVSTDDQEIAEISARYGAPVPFMRPAELASDTARAIPVLQHAVQWLKSNQSKDFDYVMMLQPTSPLRLAEDIDKSIEKIVDTGADSVFSMKKITDFSLPKLKVLEGDKILPLIEDEGKESKPRNEAGPEIYKRNCAVYLTKTNLILDGDIFGKDSRAYLMPEERSVDINEPYDFEIAEFFLEKNNKILYNKKICIIGMGYVGLTLALTFSDLGFKVVGVEKREKVISRLKEGTAHFYEDGLTDILRRELGKGFDFTTDVKNVPSDIYIIAVGTPVDFGKKPDFSSLDEISHSLGKILKKNDLVMLRSTVSPGTTRNFVVPILEKESGLLAGRDFYVSFAPERTIEGNALEELKTLPQVIGGINSESSLRAADLFKKITKNIIFVNSLEAAEMVKLANNLCRDVNFAFANELALVCDKFNIDAHEVINAANFGYPRNHIALPSPGVGGYCLTKDSHILTDATEKRGYVPNLIMSARSINEYMPVYVFGQIEKFLRKFNKDIAQAKFFILGIAFKGRPDTSDIRFSPALDVAKLLKEKGATNLHGFDPVVSKEIIHSEGLIFSDIESGFYNTDCVMIMNNHPFFEKLEIVRHLEKAKKPVLFFDTWRLFSPENILKQEGVSYSNLGFDNFSG